MLRLLKYVFFVTLILTVVGLIIPPFVDWNSHRDEFAARLEKITGQDVRIEGGIRFRILPAPEFHADNISIGDSLTAESMGVRLALWELLNGAVRVSKVSLEKPVLTYPADFKTGVDFGDVRFDDIEVVDGTIKTQNLTFGQIFLDVYAESLAGPFTMQGGFGLGGSAFDIEIAGGRAGDVKSIPVKLMISNKEARARAEVSGVLAFGNKTSLQGELKLDVTEPFRLTDQGNQMAVDPMLKAPFSLSGVLTLDPSVLKIDNLSLVWDYLKASGKFDLAATPEKKNIDIELKGEKFDFDIVTPFLPDSLKKRWPQPPQNLSGRISFDFGEFVYDERLLDDFRLRAVLGGNIVAIEEMSLSVPGRRRDVKYKAVGSYHPGENTSLALDVDVRGPDIAALWPERTGLPAPWSGAFTGQSEIVAKPGTAEVRSFVLTSEAGKVTGSANVTLAGGRATQVDISAAIENGMTLQAGIKIDPDRLIFKDMKGAGSFGEISGDATTSAVEGINANLVLGEINLDNLIVASRALPKETKLSVSATAGKASYMGHEATDATMSVRTMDGVFLLDKLSGAYQGGKISVEGLADAAVVKGTVEISGVDASAFSEKIGFDKDVVTSGAVDLVAELQSEKDIVSGAGDLRISGYETGKLSVEKMRDVILAAATVEGMKGGLEEVWSAGKTKFETAKGRFKIENGLVKTNEFILSSAAADVVVSGSYGFSGKEVDFKMKTMLKSEEKIPAFDIAVAGKEGKFKTSFDTKDIAFFMERQAADKVEQRLEQEHGKPLDTQEFLQGVISDLEKESEPTDIPSQ